MPDRMPLGGRTLGLRQQLALINLLAAAAFVLVGVSASNGLGAVSDATEELGEIGEAATYLQHADMLHDAVRDDVLQALVGGPGAPAEVAPTLDRHIHELHVDLARVDQVWINANTTARMPGLRDAVGTYAQSAQLLVKLAESDPKAARDDLGAFQGQFAALETRFSAARSDLVEPALEAARGRAMSEREAAHDRIFVGLLVALVSITVFLQLFGVRLVHGLDQVIGVARAMKSGDLSTRNTTSRADEVGDLGRAFNEMADSLAAIAARRAAEAERTKFTTTLSDAFEVADTYADAVATIERAFHAISPDQPVELLLADSTHAPLQRAAEHPTAGPSGCSVESPWACVAVRRSSLVEFPDSEALDACPRLRSRPGGRCSAVCVPVSFMGRSMGVLHTTVPYGSPSAPEGVDRLRTLAAQAGARIGTIRIQEMTQLQASTDGLTGLLNRRTAEDRAHQLVAAGRSFTLALGDLDFFKRLNDTYGHEAGDRALRRFAQILRDSARGSDICARFGGEEFLMLFPDTPLEGATNVLERVRTTLSADAGGTTPIVTASFGLVARRPGEPFEDSLRRADVALYHAKKAGRNRIVLGEDDVSPTQLAEVRYTEDLAIAHNK